MGEIQNRQVARTCFEGPRLLNLSARETAALGEAGLRYTRSRVPTKELQTQETRLRYACSSWLPGRRRDCVAGQNAYIINIDQS